ncbi:MAG TPA: tetratricopeptide repeat protein [Elusimicrobiota bacterium]|nr:tetratricopeptide repeat protein [Elusimicrobiota bacterium]
MRTPVRRWKNVALALLLGGAAWGRVCGGEGPSRKARWHWAAEAEELRSGKKYEPAAALLEKAVVPGAAEKDLVRWWPALGHCYEALKIYDRALDCYRQALQLRPGNPDRMLDLARIYTLVDLHPQAVEIYEKILKKNRHRKDVLLALASSYCSAGRLDSARSTAERYLKAEPQDWGAHRLLAVVEESLGDTGAAARRWEKILAVQPAAAEYGYLGRLWARVDEYALAQRAFDKAESLGLKSPRIFVERGILAWRQGKNDEAARHWRRTLGLWPDDALARFLLALTEFEAGRYSPAKEEMKTASVKTTDGYMRGLMDDFLAALEKKAERGAAFKKE